jgi:hypothetical protein
MKMEGTQLLNTPYYIYVLRALTVNPTVVLGDVESYEVHW